MQVIVHFLASLIFAFIGFLFFGFNYVESFVFVAAGFLIDIDHYWSYWYYTGDYILSYKKIRRWCYSVGPKMDYYFLFHNIFFLIVVIWTGEIYPIFRVVKYALIIHFSMDILWDICWYINGKNVRAYRRWILPESILKKLNLDFL